MKKLLIIAAFLAVHTNSILSKKAKSLPNSRFGLRCYNENQKLDIKTHGNEQVAYCTDQYGNPIARPQLFDLIKNKTVLFGPGSMHEDLMNGGFVRVAGISGHGMRVNCAPHHQTHISPQGHISCVIQR